MATQSLPPRLSDQQRYVLTACGMVDDPVGYEFLRERAAREFDEDGDRVVWNTRPNGERWAVATTDTHQSSFARTVARLEDRELVERRNNSGYQKDKRSRFDRNPTHHIALTEAGEPAARELVRRLNDGRYDHHYRTL